MRATRPKNVFSLFDGRVNLLLSSMLVLSLVAQLGCTSTVRITKEQIHSESNRSITVLTKDGRTIFFKHGKYKIIDLNGGTIQGKGDIIVDMIDSNEKEFDGRIGFDEIEQITTTQPSVVGQVAGLGLVAVVFTVTVIGVIFLVNPDGFKMH